MAARQTIASDVAAIKQGLGMEPTPANMDPTADGERGNGVTHPMCY
jgi:hypothetical protein